MPAFRTGARPVSRSPRMKPRTDGDAFSASREDARRCWASADSCARAASHSGLVGRLTCDQLGRGAIGLRETPCRRRSQRRPRRASVCVSFAMRRARPRPLADALQALFVDVDIAHGGVDVGARIGALVVVEDLVLQAARMPPGSLHWNRSRQAPTPPTARGRASAAGPRCRRSRARIRVSLRLAAPCPPIPLPALSGGAGCAGRLKS